MGTIARAQFNHDIGDMELDGVFSNVEFAGDRLVVLPFCHQ